MSVNEKISSDKKIINQIFNKALVCRIAMVYENKPYIVPLCFGYENNCLFFHSSNSGKKINILKQNPNACFELDIDVEVMKSEEACNWNMKYKSVIGFGKVIFISKIEEKIRALEIIVKHYSDKSLKIPEHKTEAACVFKIEIGSMTCKSS